jgi:hypothetical protein
MRSHEPFARIAEADSVAMEALECGAGGRWQGNDQSQREGQAGRSETSQPQPIAGSAEARIGCIPHLREYEGGH